MFFIFGWGHQIKKNVGPVFKYQCNHCNNEVLWELWKISNWFTLFFIPIIPYETKHLLLCPICSWGVELQNDRYEELKKIAEINKQLIDGKINIIERDNSMKLLNKETPKTTTVMPPGFCNNCGKKIDPENKFCPSCGEKQKDL